MTDEKDISGCVENSVKAFSTQMSRNVIFNSESSGIELFSDSSEISDDSELPSQTLPEISSDLTWVSSAICPSSCSYTSDGSDEGPDSTHLLKSEVQALKVENMRLDMHK
jgi:hypothetical protein